MAPMFRDIRADEIECRVAQAKENGVALLLYKDARVDQNILDETVGAMNWQRHHGRDNANCTVSIWDDAKGQWIGKEDTGTESNTEKEKGLASDSFKRACFNWGIGRELYTAPFIWIKAADCTALKKSDRGDKWQCFDSFEVDSIEISNKRIVGLAIKNTKNGKICFVMSDKSTNPVPTPATAPKKQEEPMKPEAPQKNYIPSEPPLFRCEECRNVIKTYIGKDGKEVGLRKHVMASKAQFNRELCIECIKKIKEKEGKN